MVARGGTLQMRLCHARLPIQLQYFNSNQWRWAFDGWAWNIDDWFAILSLWRPLHFLPWLLIRLGKKTFHLFDGNVTVAKIHSMIIKEFVVKSTTDYDGAGMSTILTI